MVGFGFGIEMNCLGVEAEEAPFVPRLYEIGEWEGEGFWGGRMKGGGGRYCRKA